MPFFPRKSVVVPVDFSESSFEALSAARGLVSDAASLTIVHVLPLMSPMDPGIVWEAWNDDERKRHALEALQERLTPELRGARLEVMIGDPARSVTTYARDHGTDLIVLSSHGRTGAARLLIGSVAERIVRHAHCPVLVLRQ